MNKANTDNEVASESALLKRLVLLGHYRLMIAGGVLIVATLTAVISCVMPPTYTATTVILTPQTMPSSAAALLGQLSSLGSLASSLAGGENQFKSPADTFLGVLSSRTVSDDLIKRFDLQHHYKKRTLVDTRLALAHHTHIEVARGWLIRISVEDHDVHFAASLANGYVDSLYLVNQQLALTTGSQRRLFLEQQLDSEKIVLTKAEEAFQQIQQKTGMIQLAGQTEITLRSIAQIRAAITSKEVELQLVRTTATEQNVRLQQIEGEVVALKEQLSKAESSAGGDSDYFIPAGRIPQTGLEYLRAARDLRYHEALFEMLAKQYEAARLEEAKSPPIIQVVDKAIPLDKRSWPPRTLLVMLATLVTTFLLCSVAFVIEHWKDVAGSPVNAKHIHTLQNMLGISWLRSFRREQP
jgi:capsule polysaccharide export protein KpsE/RkpR